MQKLLVFTSAVTFVAALASGGSLEGTTPRVYQYAAKLTTAVAKNAAKVTYTVGDEKYTDLDVCYRVKGTVSLKGVLVKGCDCYDSDPYSLATYTNNQFFAVATSEDKYTGVTFAYGWLNGASRIGSPLSSKAKVAELAFHIDFVAGPTNEQACVRSYCLSHAGFGKAASIEFSDEFDIVSASGYVVGWAGAPFCAASESDCPRCVADGDCTDAIAFLPCAFEDPYDYEAPEWDVAVGTFSFKFNKSLSNLIKPIQASDVQGTIDALVPKVFGKKAIAPSFANYMDYLSYN